MAVNVNSSVTDPFYRYKMPKLLAKVEGKGNGIKTVIANMTDIAKALERPPMYPTKYFGCELGAQTQFDERNDRYIVNGEHDAAKLQALLDGFIKKFVLCKACDNPETVLSVKKNQIHSKCKACGKPFVIDNKHKLATFIIKNPPKKEIDFSKAKENGNHAVDPRDEVDAPAVDHKGSSNDDSDWEPEIVDDSSLLTGEMTKLVVHADLDKPVGVRLDMLHSFFQKHMKEGGNIIDGKILLDEAERLELKTKAPVLLVQCLLNENILKEGQLVKYRKTFLRFTNDDMKAQRGMLGGIELLIQKHDLYEYTGHILKALYDTDIVSEDAILAWAEKPTSKYTPKPTSKKIIEKGEKVIQWLKDAEEESDEEEEDDDDDEINFNGRATHTTENLAKAKAAVGKEKPSEEIRVVADDGKEIDIDDI